MGKQAKLFTLPLPLHLLLPYPYLYEQAPCLRAKPLDFENTVPGTEHVRPHLPSVF